MNHNYEHINIFVFCGGKCGGTTLNTTFNNNGYESTHVHGIKVNAIDINDKNYINLQDNDILNIINNNKELHKIYIIDSYRLPIERKISSFFQNITIHVPNYLDVTIDVLNIIFNQKVSNIEEYHPLEKIMTLMNLPLFNSFDFNKSYNIIEHDNITFIKIRFSDIDNWDKILSEIFNKEIMIHPNNLTDNKPIAKLYNEFKQQYKIPQNYLSSHLANNIMFKIYNTEEEQQKYIEYWTQRST